MAEAALLVELPSEERKAWSRHHQGSSGTANGKKSKGSPRLPKGSRKYFFNWRIEREVSQISSTNTTVNESLFSLAGSAWQQP